MSCSEKKNVEINPLASFTHRIASFGVNMHSYTIFAPENFNTEVVWNDDSLQMIGFKVILYVVA